MTPDTETETKEPIGDPVALRALAALIESKPEEAYDQWVWAKQEPLVECGTRACLAGWAAWLRSDFEHFAFDERPASGQAETADCMLTGGRYVSVHYAAREFLDLSEHAAGPLFSGTWKPHPDLPGGFVNEQVAEALRRLADGARLHEVSAP